MFSSLVSSSGYRWGLLSRSFISKQPVAPPDCGLSHVASSWETSPTDPNTNFRKTSWRTRRIKDPHLSLSGRRDRTSRRRVSCSRTTTRTWTFLCSPSSVRSTSTVTFLLALKLSTHLVLLDCLMVFHTRHLFTVTHVAILPSKIYKFWGTMLG